MEMAMEINAVKPVRRNWLAHAASFTYLSIAAGQLAFALFILRYYYPKTLSGDFAAWNAKPLIDGFISGDIAGNLFFAAHVLMAAVITLGGLIQLLPVIRSRWPAVHRMNGRIFLAVALSLSLGGLWMVWVRGTYLNLPGAFGITLNALLIMGAAFMAGREAMARRIVQHRRWALRLFVLASAVWFMRVGYMVWGLTTGGAGIGKAMDGPFDLFLAFGNSLVPLAIVELYLFAQAKGSEGLKRGVAGLLLLCSLAILGGSFGAWMVMWGPYL